MSRRWISENELYVIREALAVPWLPAQPEEEVRRSLAWFPDPALLRWFSQGDGSPEGEVRALSLDEALAWRRQILL